MSEKRPSTIFGRSLYYAVFIIIVLMAASNIFFTQLNSPDRWNGISKSYPSDIVNSGKLTYSWSFPADYDYLGQIGIKFSTRHHSHDDNLQVEIYLNDETTPFQITTHAMDQIQDMQFFPIGLPIIEDSGGKIITVKLKIEPGEDDLIPEIAEGDRAIIARYYYPAKSVVSNLNNLVDFSTRKLYNLLFETATVKKALLATLALGVLNLSSKLPFGLSSVITLLTIHMIDVYFVSFTSNLLMVMTTVYWLAFSTYRSISSRYTALIVIITMVNTAFLLIISDTIATNKSASWSMFFLFGLVAHLGLEMRKT